MIKLLPERWPLPTEPGMYMWYVVDLSYMDVGMVQIMYDTDEHLARLRAKPSKEVYIYNRNEIIGWEGESFLTMYHQANDHIPPCDETGKPWVDGYLPFDMRIISCLPKHFIEKINGKN